MKIVTKLLAALVLTAGLAAAPALYANETGKSGGSMMGPGMMGGGMMGMMNMMGQMGPMMEQCNQMMGGMTGDRGATKPNEQWRKDSPTTPEGNR
ncbi:MAG: hypothetical protein HYW28_02575 [Rhodospirillales bacterium]|nr:hypothetical protein [Rhodospirillales bacterium]